MARHHRSVHPREGLDASGRSAGGHVNERWARIEPGGHFHLAPGGVDVSAHGDVPGSEEPRVEKAKAQDG
jgi:hypothetical protein